MACGPTPNCRGPAEATDQGHDPGSRKARVGFRIAHFETETGLRGHDADEDAAIPGPALAEINPGILFARQKRRGTAFSNEECRTFALEYAVFGFAAKKFAGVPMAGIDGGLDRSRNFGVADCAVRDVAAVQLT